jgi:type IX secretion system PorP/SprF family membrane protein
MNKFLRSLYLRISLFTFGIVFFSNSSFAQQGHVYNQFFMNPYMYNPAYAGVDGHGVVFAMYKQQWSKIGEGPNLSHATYHVPLKGGIGFGVTAFNEAQGPLNTSAGKVSGSYLVNIDRKHFLRFGLSLGMGSHQLTLPEDAIGDPAFAGSGTNYLIGDFGVTYHFGHFNVGMSLPNLFSSQLVSEQGFSEININPLDRMLFKMNYRGHINHEIAIEPHILYRYSNVLPSQFEIATIVHLKHLAWVGTTYRQDAGMVGLLGVKVKKKYAIGAAFELGNSDINSLTGSSFEIHVGMHMGGHKEHKLGHVDHHKTWFQTHSDELIAKKAAKDRRDSLLAVQNAALPVETDPDALNLGTPTVVTPVVTPAAAPWVMKGTELDRTNPDGSVDKVFGVAPPRGSGAAWGLAPITYTPDERVGANGKTEVAVKWVRIGANGKLEEAIIWTPIGEPEVTNPIQNETPVTQKDPIKTDTPVVPVITPVIEDTRTPEQLAASDQHQEVKRGNHMLELPAGNFLIGGVYPGYEAAEKKSDQMFSKGFRDVRVGYVSAKKQYYVVLKSYSTIEKANQDKASVQSGSGLKDIWVLKVNE